MESDDIAKQGDAAIQALLALSADNTRNEEKRDMLVDFILATPPLAEWPSDWRASMSRLPDRVSATPQ
ncbi:hypothetical protein [Mycobacterium genavense]|uniref:hypothetical protein n=1 Tax=Mycobacterium genavense TaxID=36812 RepID=UPI00046E8701|nr:hypothetical protein [Mycobacterium genavense]